MIIHVNVKYFFSFPAFFPSLSIELRFNCATSAFRACSCENMVYHTPARNLHTRVHLTLQGETYQPESKIQQPSQRRSEFPHRFQTDRHRQPSRTIPVFRQWHRSVTTGRTVRRTGKSQNRRGSRPGGNANRQRPQGGGGRHTKGRKHFSKSEPKEENSESEIEVEGTICAVLAGTMFKVRLPNGHEVLAHISGKMRKRFIKIVVGDKVRMEMSPYDMTKARITFRIG